VLGGSSPGLADGSAHPDGLSRDEGCEVSENAAYFGKSSKQLLLPAQPRVSSREPSLQLSRDHGLNSSRRRAPILFFAEIYF